MTEQFRVLTDREHVLKRANVYLGSLTEEPISGIINYRFQTKNIVPALIKSVEEIYQNSIDEHIRTKGEFAKTISLDIRETTDGTEIVVTDDGRGIPVKKLEGTDHWIPVLAWTELRAGSNFDDSKRDGAGTNGMGAALANIFSTAFVGVTCDGVKKLTLACSDNMSKIDFKVTKGTKQGTEVSFVPDLSRFGLSKLTQEHIDVLRDRFENMAILYPNITFSFCGEKIKIKNLKQVAKNFYPGDDVMAVTYNTPNISLLFGPSGDDGEFRCLSYVNSIYIKNGGAHVDLVMSKIIETLREAVKKKHKVDVLPNQIKQHLLFASWVTGFTGLKFDSQSKERITNSASEVMTNGKFFEIDFEKIAKQILGTPAIIDPMIAAIVFRQQMADAKNAEDAKKKISKKLIVNHIAATHPDPMKRRLLICEGNSAIGSLIAVRDSATTGGYPLKGKPLNVRGKKTSEIMKNVEIAELLHIIGLELGKPAINLNYGELWLFPDRDLDGEHVFCLLLNLFSNWPELFTDNKIFRLMSPLWYCTKGNKVKMFYSDEEFKSFNSTGWEVDYFKGLGSMPEDVYSECVNNPVLELVVADDLDKLEMAFGDDPKARKKWMMG